MKNAYKILVRKPEEIT